MPGDPKRRSQTSDSSCRALLVGVNLEDRRRTGGGGGFTTRLTVGTGNVGKVVNSGKSGRWPSVKTSVGQ